MYALLHTIERYLQNLNSCNLNLLVTSNGTFLKCPHSAKLMLIYMDIIHLLAIDRIQHNLNLTKKHVVELTQSGRSLM